MHSFRSYGPYGICLMLLLWITAYSVHAQGGKETLQNSELRAMYSLLEKWKYPVYYDDSEEPWEQQVRISERQQLLSIAVRPYREGNQSGEWLVVHQVPLLAIDTLTMHYPDSLLLFHTRGNRVGHFQSGAFRAARSEKAGLHTRLPEVRNLAGQLLPYIRNYQQQHAKAVPASARQLVANAVYDYLSLRSYPAGQVNDLLSKTELFIPKCQLCEGTRDGFRDYAKNSPVTGDAGSHTWDLRVALFGGSTEEQLASLEKLVEEAVADFFDHYCFSEEAIAGMRSMLAAERQRSMSLAGDRKCASCDGACKPGRE